MPDYRCQNDRLLESYAPVACCCRREDFARALVQGAWSRRTREAAARLLQEPRANAHFLHVVPGLALGPSICPGNLRLDLEDVAGRTHAFLIPAGAVAEALGLVSDDGVAPQVSNTHAALAACALTA